jgi:integrase
MLKENNVRTEFFEWDQFQAVCRNLPAPLQAVMRFAYVTGWRIDSEILPLEWRQVDFDERLTPSQKIPGTVRLDAGTTKNDEGRVFPFTEELRGVLEAQHAEHLRLKQAGKIAPWVFFRLVAKGRGGATYPKRITRFNKAWKNACLAAGAPGRIPHDLRRTAVSVAMRLTGHKTRSVFERYNIVSDGDLGTAAERIDDASKTALPFRGGFRRIRALADVSPIRQFRRCQPSTKHERVSLVVNRPARAALRTASSRSTT